MLKLWWRHEKEMRESGCDIRPRQGHLLWAQIWSFIPHGWIDRWTDGCWREEEGRGDKEKSAVFYSQMISNSISHLLKGRN